MPTTPRRQFQTAHPRFGVIHEANVPMKTRDGVVLYSDVIRPDAPGRFPVLITRTPYGKTPDAPWRLELTEFFVRRGYVAVTQDCRGRFASEGEYTPHINDINDGYDAVEWAARQPWSNGRVGTFGQSYAGATQYMLTCNDPMPPHLQAMAPVSASANYHESWVYHTGGAMLWCWAVPYAIHKGRNTVSRIGREDLLATLYDYTLDVVNFARPLKPEWYAHLPLRDWIDRLKETAPYFADYLDHHDDGPYWQRFNVRRFAPSISVPILHISSWYDIFLEGALGAYESIRDESRSSSARRGQRLLIGPWGHLFPFVLPTSQGTGDIDFGEEALIDLLGHELRWFDYWLKDVETGILDEPPVTAFLMGENRWRSYDDWPPPNVHYQRFYLHGEGAAKGLAGDGRLSTVPPGDEPSDGYTYDPRDPVPTLGGSNLTIPLGVQDQRPAENRADVLVYTSEPLDRPLEVTGPIKVHLWAATTAPDTDFTAKLVDVHPDGYARNLQDGIIRARYRESASQPRPIEPGRAYEYEIDLWATSNVFLTGHRIRLDISSSNFPRFDRNPNTGAPFGSDARLEPARQTVFHRTGQESFVVLPIIPR